MVRVIAIRSVVVCQCKHAKRLWRSQDSLIPNQLLWKVLLISGNNRIIQWMWSSSLCWVCQHIHMQWDVYKICRCSWPFGNDLSALVFWCRPSHDKPDKRAFSYDLFCVVDYVNYCVLCVFTNSFEPTQNIQFSQPVFFFFRLCSFGGFFSNLMSVSAPTSPWKRTPCGSFTVLK